MRKASTDNSFNGDNNNIQFNCEEIAGPIMTKRELSAEEKKAEQDEVEEYAIHDSNDEYKLSFMKRKRPPV